MSSQAARAGVIGAQDEYVDFVEAVHALCGVDLLQYKRSQMERRIRSHADRRGATSLTDYLRRLRESEEELESFLDRVTINVSQLWRNPRQWTILERDVLPELAESGAIRAWSAGCSYGAEAYTLASVSRLAAPAARVRIEGTDIDKRMVARAREGVFSEDDGRDAPPELLARFFDKTGDGGWAAKTELRGLVSFETGDLLKLEPMPGSFDLVLCRNTVIYFKEDVRDALHARLARSLRPGGYLIVGATERVANQRELGLEITHPFTYRKAG
jgi:chemotaxis protein methyltransferase CheR